MKKFTYLILLFFLFILSFTGSEVYPADDTTKWVDSVFNSLDDDQRIAQLMIIRESSFNAEGPVYFDSLIRELVSKYNIGGICLFQGTPVKQANLINEFQTLAQTPLMVAIDGEWGLGMRLDSVTPLKHQMMLGATGDTALAYKYGRVVGRQMKRMGIHVNYAPVVDINNNPENPVINDRSFGQNKYVVASLGLAYAKGLQDEGIIACAKHFPGHGDVAVDSHLDLPLINKTADQLDSLELFPFKKMIEGGVASVMVAHLFIPSIDNTPNTASSISRNTVTGLLRNKLHFKGLTFTDALDMKGVAKYFPGGEIAAQSLIAGNDMLCLPEDVSESIKAIRKAIKQGKLSWDDIYNRCKKVLRYKYNFGIAKSKPIDINNLTEDLNREAHEMNLKIAENAITLLRNKDNKVLPLKESNKRPVAYVGLGLDSSNTFGNLLKSEFGSDNFYFNYSENSRRISSIVNLIQTKYEIVIISLHNYKRFPANKFGISEAAIRLANESFINNTAIIFGFGNPYALQYFCNAGNLVACYEDDSVTQTVAIDLLKGYLPFRGRLPVSVCRELQVGAGITEK